MKLLLVLAVILALLSCGPSNSKRTRHDTLPTTVTGRVLPKLPPTTRLIALARLWAGTYWHGTRCVSIAYHYHALPERIIAESYWSFNPDRPTLFLTCSVTFNPAKMLTGFPLYCAAVVHEFGHLSGRHHSRNPNSVMYPILTARNIPAVCKRSTK